MCRWPSGAVPDLAGEAARRGIVESVSASTVRRWLAADALKPWQHQRWLYPRDPQFAVKAGRVLDLYAGVVGGRAPGAGRLPPQRRREDEHPGAGAQCHATTPPRSGQPMRVEHGTRAAARWPTWRRGMFAGAASSGAATPTTGIAPCGVLVAQVLAPEPDRSAPRVCWIVDHGSSHAAGGRPASGCRGAVLPNPILVHLPTHASWRNQIEIYFSIVQRKVLSPNDFPDLDAVERRLLAFEALYNDTAVPFHWRFNRNDLNRLLTRIAA